MAVVFQDSGAELVIVRVPALEENQGTRTVDEIRRLMFVFEDIGRFSDKDIQTVLKNVETSQWAMALKGASDSLKDNTNALVAW